MKIRTLLPLLFFLCGCGAKAPQFEMPSFEQEVHGRVELLRPEDLSRSVDKIVPYKDYLVLFGGFRGGMLHVCDKRSGELVKSAVFSGRGPGEIITNLGADFNAANGDVVMWDIAGLQYLMFNLDDVLTNPVPEYRKGNENVCNWSNMVFPLADGRMLMRHLVSSTGLNPQKRFVIYDGGAPVFSYNEFPIPDTTTNLNFRLYQQSRFSIAPGRDKLVEGTSMNGALLEVFDLASDRIVSRWTKFLVEPRYDHETGREIKPHLFGFVDVYAAEECIVTVLGDDRQDAVCSICIFDWEGRPIKRIVLEDDYSVKRACMDEAGMIYAVVEDKDTYLYLVRIVETGPADGYSIPADKIERFTHEEDSSPRPFF